jgi:hypothetical protein
MHAVIEYPPNDLGKPHDAAAAAGPALSALVSAVSAMAMTRPVHPIAQVDTPPINSMEPGHKIENKIHV